MAFKDRIRELRLARHLTQADVAKGTNLSQSSIGMYEQGRRLPSFEVLEAFADFFNVDLNTLSDNAPIGANNRDMRDLRDFLNRSSIVFDGETIELDDEDRRKIEDSLKVIFWDAKKKNKRK